MGHKIIITIGLLISISIGLLHGKDSSYIYVDEYYKHNPQQKESYESFINIVSGTSIPIKLDQEKPLSIYMVYPGDQISDYWQRSKSSFEARLKELGIKYELIDLFTKPSIEINKQAEAIQKAIEGKADFLIFTLDANKHVKFISTIVSQKKPKLILQNITTPLKQLGSVQPFLYVGFDHALGAQILADQYIKTFQKDAKYGVLYGPRGYVSHMRGDTFISYVEKKTNFELLDKYYTDFNKDKAKKATLDLIKNNTHIDFIYACSTDIALGALEAIEEKGLLGKIKVNGWGGGSAELASIMNNKMDFTVMRMNDDNGVAMAEAIKLDLENKTSQVPLIYSGSFELVTQGISKEKLENLKKRAFRYSDR